MKFCKYCNKYYDEKEFGVAKTTPTKVYRRLKCRFCYQETKNTLTAKNKQWVVIGH